MLPQDVWLRTEWLSCRRNSVLRCVERYSAAAASEYRRALRKVQEVEDSLAQVGTAPGPHGAAAPPAARLPSRARAPAHRRPPPARENLKALDPTFLNTLSKLSRSIHTGRVSSSCSKVNWMLLAIACWQKSLYSSPIKATISVSLMCITICP